MELPLVATGRAFQHEGVTYYSPNSDQPVPCPPRRDDNVYRFPNNECRHENFKQPLWWTPVYGWLSFVPTTTKLTETKLFQCLEGPMAEPLTADSMWWGLGEARLQKWMEVEDVLFHVIVILAQKYHFPGFLKPSPIASLHPRTRRHNVTCATQFVTIIRDWLFMWIGLLSYLIARTKESSQYGWSISLGEHGVDHSIIDQLAHSTVCDFTKSTPRAGVFIDPLAPRHGRPDVEFFVKCNVPVWYIWSPQHGQALLNEGMPRHMLPSQSELSRVGQNRNVVPSPLLPNEVTPKVTLSLQPSKKRDPNETAYSKKKKAYLALKPWKSFFDERAIANLEKERKESSQDKQKRLNRERNHPRAKNTSAFVWDWDINSTEPRLVRRKITLKELQEDYLPEFETYQYTYCAFTNQWDFCEHWEAENEDDHQAEQSNAEWQDQENNPPPTYRPVPASQVDPDHDSHQAINDRRPIHLSLATVAALLNNPLDPPREETSAVRWDTSDVVSCLYYRHGFTAPQDKSPLLPGDQKPWEQAMGALSRVSSTPLSAAGGSHRHVVSFVTSLKTKQKPLSRLYDLDPANSNAIARGDFWATFERKGVWLLLKRELFHDVEVDSWQLGVTDVADAMFIYRLLCVWRNPLGERPGRRDIIKILLDLCLPFQTFDPASLQASLKTIHCMIPYRLFQHHFTMHEYHNYVNMRQHLLRSDRGRAALLAGGIVSRLAQHDIGAEEAMSGPSLQVTEYGIGISYEADGVCYADDKLTKEELDLICGVFYTPTGQGMSATHFSWWPPHHHWMHPVQAGHNCRYWSERNEQWYASRLDEILSGIGQPRSASQWATHIKGLKHSVRIANATTEFTSAFLQEDS